MIESYFWKEDLRKHAKSLKPVIKPPKWSERLVVNFEKKLIISFFMIRKLFETHKVSQKSRSYKASIFCYKPTGKKITHLNHTSLNKIYDLEDEKEVQQGILFIANQLIHSCTIFAYRKSQRDRNWDGVYACSDFERNNTIYRIPISEIIKIFRLVGNDYPTKVEMKWDEKIDDYRISTN